MFRSVLFPRVKMMVKEDYKADKSQGEDQEDEGRKQENKRRCNKA